MLIEMKHLHIPRLMNSRGLERLSGYAPIFEDHDPSKEYYRN